MPFEDDVEVVSVNVKYHGKEFIVFVSKEDEAAMRRLAEAICKSETNE